MVNGGFNYGYLFMGQHPDTPKVFKRFLSNTMPSRILEIGTFHGGLTLSLRDILDELELKDTPILTYDVNDQEFLKPLVINRNVEVRTKNLFNYNNNTFIDEQCENEIKSFIQKDGLSIVLCDGGCKKCEFNTIAPILKNNDIIMAHDYAPNLDYFNTHIKNKIWDWLEIQDSDIEQVVKQYNLQPYHQDTTQQIAWLCKIKAKETMDLRDCP
jgi:hypothetical protein